MMTGSQYSVTRKFHLEFATNVYFESLMYCQNYKVFYREIISIRNDSSRFFVTTYKKKAIKWLALRSVIAAYIIFRIYARFKGNIKITVIVPVYGVSAHIGKFVKSLFSQTMTDGVEFILWTMRLLIFR